MDNALLSCRKQISGCIIMTNSIWSAPINAVLILIGRLSYILNPTKISSKIREIFQRISRDFSPYLRGLCWVQSIMQYWSLYGMFCLLLYMQIKYIIFYIQFRARWLISIRNQYVVFINSCSLSQYWASRCHLHLTTFAQRPHSQPHPSWDGDQSIAGEREMCNQRLFWYHYCSLIITDLIITFSV